TCKYLFKAIFGSGLRLSKFLKKKLYIDLYKAPLIRIDPLHIPLLLTSKKYVENYFKKWFIQNISNLEIKN
ncbi:MAG: hypothetical protein ACP5I7_07645, partial [Sulfolobales archaeon]